MTDGSSREKRGRHTVQLLVRGDDDREALRELLDERYEVVDDDTLRPADCYLVGDRMVPVYRDELRERKASAHPTFTPTLLLKRRGANGTVPLPSEREGDGPPLVDEVVSAPVDRTTLFRRVGNLLARREQSVELSERYEDVRIRFQRLFESTNDAILVVTPAGDEIVECNPAACDLLGYTREALRSVSPTDTIHADDRGRFRSFLRNVQEAGQRSIDDLACQTKEGERRQLEVSAATLEESEQSRIILSARDVTDRKAYERELEVKSQAMDEAPVGITITDPDQEDNPMIYVNEGFEALTGYSEAEALGHNHRFLQGEATRSEPVAELRAAVEEARPASVELRNYRKDGSQFWNRVSIAPVRDDDGTVTNYVGFQQDVSERREREHDLHLFRKAVENAGHAVMITDREGTIEYVNPVFEAESGYTRAEAVGRTPRILDSGRQDEEFYERMWETILSGEQWEANLVNRRKNGGLYHVNQTISPIANEAGEITHFVAIEADVTSRRLREQQLDVLNRVLRHNLRNEMNIIRGRAELLGESLDGDEAGTGIQAHVRKIEDRVDALATLSEKAGTVRSLFRDEPPADVAYDLTELLEDVVAEFSVAHPAASVTLDDPDTVYAQVDSRLRMALAELLDNAIVHSDQPVPEVTVTAGPSSERQSGEWIDIEIADNGPGIPEHEWDAIEQGEETPLNHGTGLGLWIVHWTVSLFGGEVSLEDDSSRGARVILSLPRAFVDSSSREAPGSRRLNGSP
ncbi:MAG: PAS domain S-box protein [Salinirussus sp.]